MNSEYIKRDIYQYTYEFFSIKLLLILIKYKNII